MQPILVRPVGSKYEIVFGHRRHRACLDLELPVFAMVEQLDDKHLFALMDRENREREDLTPFEQGEMWRRALDEKLYPSARQLAGELGLSNGLVSRAVAIANLPQEVLQAFASPTQIQYRWGDALTSALNDSPSVVLKRAREIAKLKEPLDAKTVFARLIASDATAAKDELNIVLKGEVVGHMTYGKDGSVNFKLNKSVIGKSSLKGLHAAVTNFLKQNV